ncbi:EscU/YscU/HrcU family type III secretion system export apparatus switch protein [Paragemmobacter straminiformis]|uniref:EscU/YscU/HrcU family type III secretion system export apparatus switch protein n=1 Tax=Paragemmobacter straminiformis TaxID=2045119 RepID=A0A842I718_9RHOB|nr:EscU/YscU/HrcU family type III secretion system export apparatus switch protein [Gemmobacter straminiformis]MBC2834768.1 EscU/YscU/HrcU family type III secretion system export apparatus switch protein [Gemmobacter straminiformis]
MAEDEGAERSQEPTQKRKDDAREEGQVLTSKEAMVFAGFAVATGLLSMGPKVLPQFVPVWADYFRLGRAEALGDLTNIRIAEAFWHILGAAVAVALPLMAAIIGLQVVLGGLHWSPKAMGFNPGRINPAAGLGRMVSVNALVELAKAVVKVAVLCGIGWLVVQGMLPQLGRLWSQSAGTALSVLGGAILKLVSALTLGLAAIGAADLAWQILSMRKKMMMTLQEVKEEGKEQNGSPEVKGRMRQLQMEASRRAAKQRRALDDVPRATAIITNPTHFAVAIRYVPGETRAPVILAMGKGPMAHEVMARGRKVGLAPLQVPILARALYFTGDIGAEIDEQLFGAVAAILAHVYRLERGEGSSLPEVDLPEGLRFDEFGRAEGLA